VGFSRLEVQEDVADESAERLVDRVEKQPDHRDGDDDGDRGRDELPLIRPLDLAKLGETLTDELAGSTSLLTLLARLGLLLGNGLDPSLALARTTRDALLSFLTCSSLTRASHLVSGSHGAACDDRTSGSTS
jgi:hypothetical protein